jgi:hypothetical protein
MLTRRLKRSVAADVRVTAVDDAADVIAFVV